MAATRRDLEKLEDELKRYGALDDTAGWYLENCYYYVDRAGEQYRYHQQLKELAKYLYKQGIISSSDIRYYTGY